MKVEFRINGSTFILFVRVISCLRTVCCYYSVASFCSSFYSTWGETKGVGFCSFVTKFDQACTKYSAKCIQQFPYDPHTWRVAQDFHKVSFLDWNSPKTLQKINKILIGTVIRHFYDSEKIPSFRDGLTFFPQ